ncbi:MAG: T9SS type A sorting domain-containing protein [Bacteroidetes bacterium]|nr:T9SS type A sorting domain-containing protein [Bacteroidota bacterium]
MQPSLNGIGRYDGSGFQPLGRGINNGMVRCMQEYNGSLYVGGNFTTVDSNLNARRIARWDGNNWHTIGTGMSGGLTNLFAMTVYKGELYIGGYFSSIDGFPSQNICRYNGVAWDSVKSGVNGFIRCMVVDSVNDILYVGGSISSAGGILTPTGVAAWDGTSWSAVGTAPILNPVDMVIYRGKLFAGGIQKGPNSLGQTVFQMAWFDGQNWIPACDTMYGGEIESMCVYKDELYVGGFIKMIDDSARYGIARTHFPNVTVQQISNTEATVELYPNPTGSVLTVRIKDTKLKLQSAQLSDLNGVGLIRLDKLNESQVNLDLQSIASGMYIVVVKTERGTSQYKIVKE